MFHAVVDFDGFTGAASHLHISQSAISYSLAKLQEQLGVSLLKLEGRKARVTEEGRILLERSRDLVRNAVELEALAENLRQGWGPEIRLSVDPRFPTRLLMRALRKLSPNALDVRLIIEEMKSEQAKTALQNKAVDLMIAPQVPVGFAGEKLTEIEHVAVAHADHPLFLASGKVAFEELEKHLQIVISGMENHAVAEGSPQVTQYSKVWMVSSFDAAIDALHHCLGYAWLPKHRVQRMLSDNQIKRLPLDDEATHKTALYLIYGRTLRTNSVAKRFTEALFDLAASDAMEDA